MGNKIPKRESGTILRGSIAKLGKGHTELKWAMEESLTATEKEYGKGRIWDLKHQTKTSARILWSKDEKGKKQTSGLEGAKGSRGGPGGRRRGRLYHQVHLRFPP